MRMTVAARIDPGNYVLLTELAERFSADSGCQRATEYAERALVPGLSR